MSYGYFTNTYAMQMQYTRVIIFVKEGEKCGYKTKNSQSNF